MTKYHRIKESGNDAYLIDEHGNRIDDIQAKWLIDKLSRTVEKTSYLYIGYSLYDEDNLYKVGYSNDPFRRQREVGIEIVFCLEARGYGELSAKHFESLLHRLLKAAGLHKEGEWFYLNATDIELIKAFFSNDVKGNNNYHLSDTAHRLQSIVEFVEKINACDDWGQEGILEAVRKHTRQVEVDDCLAFIYMLDRIHATYEETKAEHLKGAQLLQDELCLSYLEWHLENTEYKNVEREKWDIYDVVA